MGRKPRAKVVREPIREEPALEAPAPRARTLVFISHDSRDAELAELFANLLSDVSGGILKSFRSSDRSGTGGIDFGAEWYRAIMLQIDDATDVVALLTPRSIDRPWILYEAGVAKGKLGTVVFGVALGAPLERVSTGPFGQFQNCGDDEDSLTKLVMQLLSRNPDASPREEAIRLQVKLFKERASDVLKRAAADIRPTTKKEDDESAAKLFEEIKAMVRNLSAQYDRPSRGDIRSRPSFADHRTLQAVEDILFARRYDFMIDGDMSTPWLVFVSLLRDDFPWLHEPGLDLYKAMKSGKLSERRVVEFTRLFELTLQSPLRDLRIPEGKIAGSLIGHLPGMVSMFLHQALDQKGPKQANIFAAS